MKSTHVINFTQGFFWNTSNRGVRGLNWARNENLPDRVRESRHSIGLPESIIDYVLKHEWLEARVSRQDKMHKEIFMGRFRISAKDIFEWSEVNGYYTTKAGKEMLAIPLALWEVLEQPPTTHENQLSLFEHAV